MQRILVDVMQLSPLIVAFLGLKQGEENPTLGKRDTASELSAYSSDLAEVQGDLLSIFPQSFLDSFATADSYREQYSLVMEAQTAAWYTTLSQYYTKSQFQELLRHTTESWYRSSVSAYGKGPLDSFTALDKYYPTTGGSGVSDAEATATGSNSTSSRSRSSGTGSSADNMAYARGTSLFAVGGAVILALV